MNAPKTVTDNIFVPAILTTVSSTHELISWPAFKNKFGSDINANISLSSFSKTSLKESFQIVTHWSDECNNKPVAHIVAVIDGGFSDFLTDFTTSLSSSLLSLPIDAMLLPNLRIPVKVLLPNVLNDLPIDLKLKSLLFLS